MSVASVAWHVLEGATKYLTLPQVAPERAEQRAAVCRSCPNLVHARLFGIGPRGGYCGKPLPRQPDPTGKTCGCLVTWGDDDAPAGKTTRVGGCPSGRF
jgi:hypothetical protein